MADLFSSILKKYKFNNRFSVKDRERDIDLIENEPGIYIISREKDETHTPITVNESEALRKSVKKDLENDGYKTEVNEDMIC